MADELGPEGKIPSALDRGELPQRLVALMLRYAEVMRYAGPWLTGEDIHVPLTQLRVLGTELRELEVATDETIAEARKVHREIERRRAAAQAQMGGAA